MLAGNALSRILVLGPNPALQRVVNFDAPLELGGVNRASAITQYVGGKGQGVGAALQRWAPGSTTIAQFLGGDTGTFIEGELAAAGLQQITKRVTATTRICTTLLASNCGGGTELIDPSGAVADEEVAALLSLLKDEAPSFDSVALCGTTPPGAACLYGDFTAALAKDTRAEHVTLLLDGHKQVEDVLRSGRVDVLKLNLDEVKALTGASSAADAAAALFGSDGPLQRAGAVLAITDGPRPALLFTAQASYQLRVPALECVNAIGAGDVCTGVFLHSLTVARKEGGPTADPAPAFADGLAAACARCTHLLPMDWQREEAGGFRARVAIEPL